MKTCLSTLIIGLHLSYTGYGVDMHELAPKPHFHSLSLLICISSPPLSLSSSCSSSLPRELQPTHLEGDPRKKPPRLQQASLQPPPLLIRWFGRRLTLQGRGRNNKRRRKQGVSRSIHLLPSLSLSLNAGRHFWRLKVGVLILDPLENIEIQHLDGSLKCHF